MTLPFSRVLSVFLVAAAAVPAMSSGEKPAEPTIAGVAERWAKLWSEKQLEPIVALYASDAIFLTGTGDRITGKTSIRNAFQKGMASVTAHLTVRSISTESSGDLAYDSGDYRETITLANGTQHKNRGSYVVIFRRQAAGGWLIVQHVWTEAPPAGK